jgi:elongation factor Ts
MADISAADVKRLREKTGAGMMECKNALVESAGDADAAEKLLKEKGLAALEKRSDRATNAGRVFVRANAEGNAAALVELSSETDFVARNPEFIELGGAVAKRALEKCLESGAADASDAELCAMVAELATKIRENMGLKRLSSVKAGPDEYFAWYIHGDGEIGVVVKCASDKPEVFADEEVKSFVFSLALHVAAFHPRALDRSAIDAAYIEEQREIFAKQMEQDEKLAGKPAGVLEGILKGKLNKHLADICMMDQGYVKDEKFTVAQAIEDRSKKSGAKIRIASYEYFKVGA